MLIVFTVDLPTLTRRELVTRWLQLAPIAPEEGRPVEMDPYGELTVAPLPTNRHQVITALVQEQLKAKLGGLAVAGIAILTRIGIRVPDVCWAPSPDALLQDPAPSAPEICVEVASPGNSEKWLLEKAAAHLEAGARESIIIGLDGRIRYFDARGERSDSAFGLDLRLPAL